MEFFRKDADVFRDFDYPMIKIKQKDKKDIFTNVSIILLSSSSVSETDLFSQILSSFVYHLICVKFIDKIS